MQYRGLFVGLTTIDIQYFVDEFPISNKKIKTNPPDVLVGGPASNAAVAFSYLNKGANLISAVGQNPFTGLIHDDFKTHNISLTDLVESEKFDPVIASVVTSGNGDRNIFTNNPGNIDAEIDIDPLFLKLKPDIVMLDGFYPQLGLVIAEKAKKEGIPVVVDCGSWKPQYDKLLQYTDTAICSADFFPSGCLNENDVFSYLVALGVDNIAISRGEKSVIFQSNDKRGELPIKRTTVIDTLGAGDFLHGAFCYYMLELKSFIEALGKATELATHSCKFKGTREWLKF